MPTLPPEDPPPTFTRTPDHPCAKFCNCKKRSQTGYAITTRMRSFGRDWKRAKGGKAGNVGKPNTQDEDFLIRVFIEVEARSRVTGLSVKRYLHYHKMKWSAEPAFAFETRAPHKHSKPRKIKKGLWDSDERQRVRKAYTEGKREACWYCCSYNAITGQPQYLWHDFMRRIEARQAELLAGPKSEFFVLTIP